MIYLTSPVVLFSKTKNVSTTTVVIPNGICIGTIFKSLDTSHERFTLKIIIV